MIEPVKIVSKRYGLENSWTLDVYEKNGGYQAILRDPETGVYAGASDPRKDGQAAGW